MTYPLADPQGTTITTGCPPVGLGSTNPPDGPAPVRLDQESAQTSAPNKNKTGKNIKLIYFNARSADDRKTLDDILQVAFKQHADIICISETWWRDSTPVTNLRYGYVVKARKDREVNLSDKSKGRGGGCAILISKKLDINGQVNVEFIESKAQLTQQVQISYKNWNIRCLYRSPSKKSNDECDILTQEWEEIDWRNMIMIGDLNVRWDRSTALRNRVDKKVISFQVVNGLKNNLTSATTTSGTQIDGFITQSPLTVTPKKVTKAPKELMERLNLDHHIYTCTLPVQPPKFTSMGPKEALSYNLKNLDIAKYKQLGEASEEYWKDFYNACDEEPEDALHMLMTKIRSDWRTCDKRKQGGRKKRMKKPALAHDEFPGNKKLTNLIASC